MISKFSCWFLSLGCVAVVIFSVAARSETATSDKVLGLVEVPKVFGTVDPNGPPGQSPPKDKSGVRLYARPDVKSEVTIRVLKRDDVTAREHGYEQESAVVFGRRDGWSLIQTKAGKGWLSPGDSGTFRAYEDLLKEGLSFLDKQNWDGKLYSDPAKAKDFKIERNPADEMDVVILAVKSEAGQSWLRIQFVEGRCEGSKERRGKQGWVKAYSERGEPNLWFRSRGC